MLTDGATGSVGCGDGAECVCTVRCEMPCWQRVGLTDKPCCADCAPLPEVEEAPLATVTPLREPRC